MKPGHNRAHDPSRSRYEHSRFALLQPLGPSAQILMMRLGGLVQLYMSGDVYAEYEEVISRPRFKRSPEIIAARFRPPAKKAYGFVRRKD